MSPGQAGAAAEAERHVRPVHMPAATQGVTLNLMTSGSTPPAHTKNEAEYARKLALALLSTLESKGFLTKVDVDAILHVAHRAALQADAPTQTAQVAKTPMQDDPVQEPRPGQAGSVKAQGASGVEGSGPRGPEAPPVEEPKSVLTAPVEVKRPLGPAVLGTRWVKPEAMTAPVRSEAADLVHEDGAVKVVGQAVQEPAAPRRPLAPAILSAGRTDAPAREDEATDPAPEAVTIAENMPGTTTEDDRQVESMTDSSAQPSEAQGGEPQVEEEHLKKAGMPVVIDFEMD